MSLLRRAIGRREALISLLIFLLAGGWFGWKWLASPAVAQEVPLDAQIEQVKVLLDAGRYREALAQMEALPAYPADQPVVLRYKALAQFLAGEPAVAMQTADIALAQASTGADTSVVATIKALVLLGPEYLRVAEARQLADQAAQQTGSDSAAVFISKIAKAAVLRSELDAAGESHDVLAHVAQIRLSLAPMYGQAGEPQAAWEKTFWRRGLAMLVDSGILVSEAGDPAGEAESLVLMQHACPPDAWACYFSTPDKALRAARSVQPAAGAVDDHARVAMYTAAGFLYAGAGDRIHCDCLFRKAIKAYGRLLEDYDGWDGKPTRTVTPKLKYKIVNDEFYTYRNRMERLEKYCADWWGMRVVRGEVPLSGALSACEGRLFRAIVRVRADKTTNPIKILREEGLTPGNYLTVADWFASRAFAPQAQFEKDRAALIQKIGLEEVKADSVIRQTSHRGLGADLASILTILRNSLDPPPTLAATRAELRLHLVDVLTQLDQLEEVMQQCDIALEECAAGDEFLGPPYWSYAPRFRHFKLKALFRANRSKEAMQLAQAMLADERVAGQLRVAVIQKLAVLYASESQPEKAAETFGLLNGLVFVDAAANRYLEQVKRSTAAVLARKGVVASVSSVETGSPVDVQSSCCGG